MTLTRSQLKNLKIMFLTLITLCALTSAHEITQLKVPLNADPRRAAELSCHFQMDDQKLHSVKWYRDLHEIFRYNPSQKTQIRLFNVTGVLVQGGTCELDSCVVRVMPLPQATRAAYTCEVSTEGPKFQIARQTKHMTVVAMPDKDPVITGAPSLVKPGEQFLLNCTTDYSLPPSDINWYIDNELQKPEAWQRTELSAPAPGGLRASWRVLRVRVPTTVSGTLRLRCESVVQVDQPVLRDTTATVTVYSRTQLSKYVSNGAMPDKDPVITGAPSLVKPGEQFLLNCTTDYSLPPSDINWYIDNELQKPEAWQRTELSAPAPGGLRASWRVLRVRVPTTVSGTLRLRCESVVQVDQPVLRDTTATVTVYSRTQLSKYVSNGGGNNYVNANAVVAIWTLIISRFMSL